MAKTKLERKNKTFYLVVNKSSPSVSTKINLK